MKGPLLCILSLASLLPATSHAIQCSSDDKEMTVQGLGGNALGNQSYALRLNSKLGFSLDDLKKNFDLESTLVMLDVLFEARLGLRVSEQRVETDGSVCLVFLPWKKIGSVWRIICRRNRLEG